jgi:hypothetical protein
MTSQPAKLTACLRAAMIGWLPASFVCGLLLLLDGAGPGFLVGHASVEQSFGLAAMVAVAGLAVGPVLGLLVGFPLLLAVQRSRLTAMHWSAVAGGIAGVCVALAAFGTGAEAVPLAAVCAAVAALCSLLAARILRQDVAHAHAA